MSERNVSGTIGFAIGVLFLGDVVLAGGHLLFHPAVSIVFGYGLEGTFWGCQTEWVTVDEGSFCRDELNNF